LVVTDAGGRRAFSTLILNILDENDCAPKFISSVYETSVLADTEDGQALFMVFAVDEDVGDQVEYTVVPDGDTRSSYIRVHPRQGIVSLRKSVRNIGLII
uniref:Cadherin domain-containing protein n=1 Tax=Anisakis simplex TaxID=6269 RepID=A0A0M3JJ53_ANISI